MSSKKSPLLKIVLLAAIAVFGGAACSSSS